MIPGNERPGYRPELQEVLCTWFSGGSHTLEIQNHSISYQVITDVMREQLDIAAEAYSERGFTPPDFRIYNSGVAPEAEKFISHLKEAWETMAKGEYERTYPGVLIALIDPLGYSRQYPEGPRISPLAKHGRLLLVFDRIDLRVLLDLLYTNHYKDLGKAVGEYTQFNFQVTLR